MSRHKLAIPTVVLLVLSGVIPNCVFAAGYDVSYLWHAQLTSVQMYEEKVARVLGPAVASKLRIVQKPGLYGLIYYRNGSSEGAERAARVHSRLLRSRRLDGAAPTRSINWNFVNPKYAKRSPSPTTQPTARAQTSTSAPKALANTNSSTPTANHKAPNKPVHKVKAQAPTRQDTLHDLEIAVENHIKRLRARGQIADDEQTAWSVYDFTTGEKLVDINEDVQFQAASLVKPFFAMAFFHKVKTGQLKYGSQSRRHMERMIQRSNNASTNWIMRRVGGPASVQKILTREYPKIFKDTRIVEYIPGGGKTYRNKASVHDYSRFLFALWEDGIPGSKEIKRLMALPGKDRLYTGAKSIPKGTRVYNKTGSTARLCGDMGILVVKDRNGKSYPYTIIGVIEKRARARNYSRWIRSRGDVIRQVSNIVYQGISQHHNLRS